MEDEFIFWFVLYIIKVESFNFFCEGFKVVEFVCGLWLDDVEELDWGGGDFEDNFCLLRVWVGIL